MAVAGGLGLEIDALCHSAWLLPIADACSLCAMRASMYRGRATRGRSRGASCIIIPHWYRDMHNNASLALQSVAPEPRQDARSSRGGRRQHRLLCRRLPGAGGAPRDVPGRPALAEEIGRHGMRISGLDGADRALAPRRRQVTSDAAAAFARGRRHPRHRQERGDGGDGRPHRPACAARRHRGQPAERRRQRRSAEGAARRHAARGGAAWCRSTSCRRARRTVVRAFIAPPAARC